MMAEQARAAEADLRELVNPLFAAVGLTAPSGAYNRETSPKEAPCPTTTP